MKSLATLCSAATIIMILVVGASAQEIPQDEYLTYVPLDYPRLVQQRSATGALHLYGDREDPTYRDVDPVDGIDDRRGAVLMALAVRFAPYLVENTTNIPTNFDIFIENATSFPLHVDTWDITGEDSKLIRTDGINFSVLGQAECRDSLGTNALAEHPQPTMDAAIEDCKMVELLRVFSPFAPDEESLNEPLIRQNPNLLSVLYFNLPGEGPGTWENAYKPEYEKTPQEKRKTFPHSYVHPFLASVDDEHGAVAGYDLVLQYFLFYPSNDGGNNHEGDWEHMNVVVAPRSMVGKPLSAETVDRILTGVLPATDDASDPLVIRRIEYYFHHFVMTLDFSSPNVYESHDVWEKNVKGRTQSRFGEDEIWQKIRQLAYVDDDETVVNTHPFGYIGADNKGFDQALTTPGGKNRDSHGTYPFPGRYIGIGPAGATEQISSNVNPRQYWKKLKTGEETTGPVFKRGSVVGLADPDRLRIIPDWERIVDHIRDDARARRDWGWLVLPILWGYPATESPFAGIIAHTDSGNLPPVGPSYNAGWNVSGPAPGFHAYEPNEMSSVFPLRFQDSFRNDLGFFNFTFPVLFNLPPFDLLSRVVAYPFELAFGNTDPVYYPKEGVPYRFVGIGSGVSVQIFDKDFNSLALNVDQYNAFVVSLISHLVVNGADTNTVVLNTDDTIDNSVSPFVQINFYIGRFAGQNTVRNMRPTIAYSADFNNIPAYSYSADINYWEYDGSLRYSLTSSRLQPFLKGGYGWSWYRVENAQSDGQPLQPAESTWVKPSIWPNVWHLGLGLEMIPWKRVGKLPGGLELSFCLQYALYMENLKLDLSQLALSDLGLIFPTLGDVPGNKLVTRNEFLFGLTITY